MIKEAIKGDDDTCTVSLSFKEMIPLALATSIDALAIGVSLSFLSEPIAPAAATIGITTFIFSAVGLYIGNAFGCRYKSKAEFLGGAVLMIIGLKILIEHTL